MELNDILIKIKTYCEKEDFKGWDPYDGLNSKVFKAIPFVGNSAIARLVWIQLFKRNPINLRKFLLVSKQRNAKGIGLFLRGYCSLWRIVNKDPSFVSAFGSKSDIECRINELAKWLLENVSQGYSGAAWGYNFPWQCRREFLFPTNEPTVVATYFCAGALFDAYEITSNEQYKQCAITSADFIKNDLHQTDFNEGSILSYSKLPGNDTIFNASLLGSAILARCYFYTGDLESVELARKSVAACCSAQAADGSWTYGVKTVTNWIDSFHTGYNLVGLKEYMVFSGDYDWEEYLAKGLEYYIGNFFLPDGAPKYYHDRQYPIDIHCVGQLFVTLAVLGRVEDNRDLIMKVFNWSKINMWDGRGYYYYQLKQGISSKISYMRWSNAFMFCALARLLEAL